MAAQRITCDQLPDQATCIKRDVIIPVLNPNWVQFFTEYTGLDGTCTKPNPEEEKWTHWHGWCARKLKLNPAECTLDSITISKDGQMTCKCNEPVFEFMDGPHGDGFDGGGGDGTGCAFVDRTHI